MTDIEIIREAIECLMEPKGAGLSLLERKEKGRTALDLLDRLTAPPSESARELARQFVTWFANKSPTDCASIMLENMEDHLAALIESSWARVREECVESWKTAMRECAEILPNKVECVLTGSDIERIEAAILAQPKEESHE